MDEIMRSPIVYFNLGPFEIDETIVSLWVISAILIVAGILLTRNFKWLPEGRQNAVEMLVEGVDSAVVFIMGESRRFFTPFIGTLMLFIVLANTAGVWSFGLLRPPTADANMTLGLGLIVFFTINFYNIKSHGLWNYVKGFFQPFVLFLPMNIFGELSKPISLGFRLFGNIFAGLVIGGLIYQSFPFLVPIPIHIYFDLFSGVLQTAVFSMLTMVFISMAMD
ncbi:MAG TPA: F0F1 ATP synthase subunit A [Firmicutes bacterium]|nr:F0F1 ATP synthase subunit A [Bacillota bacterium]